MAKKVRSEKNFWGGTNHYDPRGVKVGESHKNFWGGTTHRDAYGNKTGKSYGNFWGGTTHYDTGGKKVGESYKGILGGVKINFDDGSHDIYPTASNAKSSGYTHRETQEVTNPPSPKRRRSSWLWDSGFIPIILIVAAVNLLWGLFVMFCESR